jgi:hypothetical protein
MKRLVLKDFLSLKEGDIISLSTGSSNTIYVTVMNREIDVAFYGNDKGRWGKDNPSPKSGNNPVIDYKPNIHFKWVKESVAPFTAMEFKMPQCPKDLTKHLMSLYSGVEWEQMCMQKIIDDLEKQGVI